MKKGVKYILITFLGMLAIFLIVGACYFMPFFLNVMELKKEAEVIVDSSTGADFREIRTSVVYDCNDEVLMTYSGEKDVYYVEIEQIPQVIQDAFVVMEDQDFYLHSGVDIKAVIRSAIANYNANAIVQGASTITSQLARNIYLNQDVNWDRKILETFIAMGIEEKYSKEEILEFYLNNIYFGNGYYGIEAAAMGYFNKPVSELTMGEGIFLSAIPNNPSRYDPIAHEDNTIERARRILKSLYTHGMISDLDYLLLSDENDNPFSERMNATTGKNELNHNTADSYIYTYVTYSTVRYLMEQNGFVFKNEFVNEEELNVYDEGYDAWYNYYLQMLFTQGFRIYTSIDPKAQQLLQENADGVIAANDSELQVSAVTVDNVTGKVVAVVGGRSEECEGLGFNRAYQSFRQPGSAIKPLNVYGPYLNMGHSTEEPVYDIYNGNGPRNAGDAYAGKITLRDALRASKNTIAWQIYKYITPEMGGDFLIRLGFKKIYMDRKFMSAALGGFTYGVSAEEMTAAFRTFVNDGVYNVPTCVRYVSTADEEGEMYASDKVRIFTENASRLMTSLLKSVVDEGTGKTAKLTVHPAAGKTGTTNQNKDMWFIGYTTYYTTGVWVGYDSPKEISMDNGNLACTIWHNYMERLHIGLEPKNFEEADYIQPVENEALENLKEFWYAEQEGEPAMDEFWNGDETGIELLGDKDADITGGDEVAKVTGGDEDAKVTEGDEDAKVTEGDEDAKVTGGDEDAKVTGGDEDAKVTGGDEDAKVTGGDGDAKVTGGDEDAKVTGGDEDAKITGGDW